MPLKSVDTIDDRRQHVVDAGTVLRTAHAASRCRWYEAVRASACVGSDISSRMRSIAQAFLTRADQVTESGWMGSKDATRAIESKKAATACPGLLRPASAPRHILPRCGPPVSNYRLMVTSSWRTVSLRTLKITARSSTGCRQLAMTFCIFFSVSAFRSPSLRHHVSPVLRPARIRTTRDSLRGPRRISILRAQYFSFLSRKM